MKTIYLVQCVSGKKPKEEGAMPAEERYTSPLFRESSEYVRNRVRAAPDGESTWFILSTAYSLTPPGKRIGWYNLTFYRAGKDDPTPAFMTAGHRKWTDCVIQQIQEAELEADRIVFLAGKNYQGHGERIKEWLVDNLTKDVLTPLGSRLIGERISWLKHQNEHWDPGLWNPEGWQDDCASGEGNSPTLGP